MVAGEAGLGRVGLRDLRRAGADVVLMDLRLPGLSGVQVIAKIL